MVFIKLIRSPSPPSFSSYLLHPHILTAHIDLLPTVFLRQYCGRKWGSVISPRSYLCMKCINLWHSVPKEQSKITNCLHIWQNGNKVLTLPTAWEGNIQKFYEDLVMTSRQMLCSTLLLYHVNEQVVQENPCTEQWMNPLCMTLSWRYSVPLHFVSITHSIVKA